MYGRVTKTLTAAVLNRAESTATTINRQEHRKQYCSVANAKTFKDFKAQVERTTDATVLTDMLDGMDDEGFHEDAPRLDPMRKMQVRLRLADLQVLTTDNIAHSPFFLLHHKLGHAGMLETAKAARESGIKLPPVEDRWCEETCCSNSCTVLFGIPRVEGKMSFIKKIIKKFKFYFGTEISLNLDIYSCSSDVFPDLYLIIRR